jgi:hypothetical protein
MLLPLNSNNEVGITDACCMGRFLPTTQAKPSFCSSAKVTARKTRRSKASVVRRACLVIAEQG